MSEVGNELAVSTEFNQSKLYKSIVSKFSVIETELDNTKVDFKIVNKEASETLQQFNPEDPVQMMITAQMLSTHNLQQTMMVYAKNCKQQQNQQYYINAATKLSNLFINQAGLLNRLKNEKQSEAVKDIHVHDGGKAVVGNINCYQSRENEENRK